MPRLTTSAIRRASDHSSLLPHLLKVNRDLQAAAQELKWIQNELPRHKWKSAVIRRSKYEPLQYILGTQPFGMLEILCERGALIPRMETEQWVLKLSDIINKSKKETSRSISIVDACTGTGCISLLIDHEMSKTAMNHSVLGFDVSTEALQVAKKNLSHYQESHGVSKVVLKEGNVFNKSLSHDLNLSHCDLVVSNPPYIPPQDYKLPVSLSGIERSVREYEPSLALIGDIEFYETLVKNVVASLGAKGFVFEIGYENQSKFVASLLRETMPNEWTVGYANDMNDKIRCVIGWKNQSQMSMLNDLCDNIYKK